MSLCHSNTKADYSKNISTKQHIIREFVVISRTKKRYNPFILFYNMSATTRTNLLKVSHPILTRVKEYFFMALGMAIYSFGWIGCVLPAKGTSGAASGLAIVLSTALHNSFGMDVKIGTLVLLINAVLLLIAGFVLGWKFGIKTIFCIFALSISMNIWQAILPPEDFLHLDRFLAMVVGGVITGFGVAIALMQGGSTGGSDIVAMLINKYKPISYGRIIFVVDLLIIASSLLVGFTIDAAIYGYIMTIVFGYTADLVLAGNKQSSQVLIISQRYEEIIQVINYELKRGATLIESEGSYTHNYTKMIMVVCTNRDTPNVLKAVKQIDPDAFITVASVTGVYGQGFQPIKL